MIPRPREGANFRTYKGGTFRGTPSACRADCACSFIVYGVYASPKPGDVNPNYTPACTDTHTHTDPSIYPD